MVAVGAELIAFETAGDAGSRAAAARLRRHGAGTRRRKRPPRLPTAPALRSATSRRASWHRRRRAARRMIAGVDLASVSGSGPGGRISAQDLEAVIAGKGGAAAKPAARAPREGTEEIKIIGVRRVIAERMSAAKRNIPHFAYVEEVDVTELEALRQYLNSRQPKGAPSLTYLPFLVAALVRVLESFPQCNAVHDAERNVIVRHRAVHVGIATQTPDGLKVPVVQARRGAVARRSRRGNPPRVGSRAQQQGDARRAASARRSRSRASGGSAASPRRRSSTRRKSRSSASTRPSSGRSSSTARSRSAAS